MIKPASSLGQSITAYLYKFVLWGLSCTHVKIVAMLGICIGFVTWLLFAERRRVVARNLRIILNPNLRSAELRPLVRKNIMLTCMNFACALKVGIMSPKEMEKSISLEGKEIFENAGSDGRTGLACIPHAGNWEVLARIRPLFTKVEHFGSMYRSMSNPALEEIVYESRTRFGCEMFSKKKDIRQAIRLASKGGLLGILSDQFTAEGIFVPYFGKVTGTTPLPSLLKAKDKKGTLTAFSVFTRNKGLGKWDAVLGRTISFEENSPSQMVSDTISVNQALESCLMENILDGFWMHHRWKANRRFAPKQTAEAIEISAKHTKLPFRILVALPEEMGEAICCIPALKALKTCRFDAQLIIICPEAQKPFWQQLSSIADHVLTCDGEQSLKQQLDADSIYQDGPLDYLFMFSEDKRTLSTAMKQDILAVSGFKENRLSKKFRHAVSECFTGPARHRSSDYLQLLAKRHILDLNLDSILGGLEGGNNELHQNYIAPFSTFGEADSWTNEQWKLIAQKLGNCKLLALDEDADAAKQLAEEIGIEYCLCSYANVHTVIGKNCRLIAVDGALSQIAALYGARTTMLMASRLPDRYGPWVKNAVTINLHRGCHPCYQEKCSEATHCLSKISVEDVLTATLKN